MEEIPCTVRYVADGPYPEIHSLRKDRRRGMAILSNVGGGVSEMSAVGFYLYGQFAAMGRPEVAECFQGIAAVEMRHLNLFAKLARQLGEDPRLWSHFQGRRRYWTPEYLRYPQRLDQALRAAIDEERNSIRKYEQQAKWMGDEEVSALLLRVAADERVHLDLLTGLYRSYCGEV